MTLPQTLPLVKVIWVVKNLLPEIKERRRKGRPYVYSIQIIACCFLVMVAKKLSIRGLWQFLKRDEFDSNLVREAIGFPDDQIPDRRTFDRRLRNWKTAIKEYIRSAALFFVKRKVVGIARLATDRRMFAAFGNIWHAKYQKENIIPKGLRNIDKSASWSRSYYRGWIFGHGLDLIVNTGKKVLPVIADVFSLKHKENKTAYSMVNSLPKVKKGVLSGDCSYEDKKLEEKLKTTGRNLHVPKRKDRTNPPRSKTYQRRKVTVEPFFERFLLAFPLLRYKLPLREEQRVAGYLLTCIFLYQIAVILNLLSGKPLLEVTHFIQAL